MYTELTYSTDPQVLLRKKSIDSASALIKKVKTNLVEISKMKAELEKILADISPEMFGDLKLGERD